jgi:hypothetical protein
MGWLTTYNMPDFDLMSQNWLVNATSEPVPNVIGQTQETAQANIAAAQLVLGTVTMAYSETIAAGIVISQIPTAGTLVTAAIPVDIVVSLGQEPVGWTELVSAQSNQWHYRKGLSEPPSDWRENNFTEDATWLVGQAPVGYSNRGEFTPNTELSDMEDLYSTVYARHSFDLETPYGYALESLTLKLFIDDGCIVSINNDELHRYNVSDGTKYYNDLNTESGKDYINPSWIQTELLDVSSLQEGTNILTIHVLNAGISSSDISIEAELIANFVPIGY